jgi:hypothetical protein
MKERRSRTRDENLAVEQMKSVRYPPASWDKRFMRSLASVETITEKEAPQLWRLFIRYRRQISFQAKQHLLNLAETLSAPDLRKVEKARKEQEEIDRLKAEFPNASLR